MQIQTILFDLDGTLLDTSALIIASFQHTFLQHYGQDLTFEELQPQWGRTLRATMEDMGRPGDTDALIATYRTHNIQYHDELTTIFPGVSVALQRIAARGISMGVVTSKTQETARRGLHLFDLDGYMSTVIGLEQCSNHKPHPEPLLKGAAALQAVPATCLYVGDTQWDIQSGKRAGMMTAAVAWTKLPFSLLEQEEPDLILHSLEDICTFL